MCVLLFDVFNIYYGENLTFSKFVRKVNLLGKKNWKKCTSFEKQKIQGIFGEMFILGLLCSAVFRLQNRVSDFCKIILFGR